MNNYKNDKIIYTTGDIQRYLNGQMSAKEMHALESSALEDPFLADAIEGYNEKESLEESNTATELEELHNRLKTRIESSQQKKIIPLYKRNWLNVAVMILFITGAGILFFYFSKNSQPGNSLVAKSQIQEQKASPIDSPHADSSNNPDSTLVALNDNKSSRRVRSSNKIKTEEKALTGALQQAKTAPDLAFAPSRSKDTIKSLTDSANLESVSVNAMTINKEIKPDTSPPVVIGYGTRKKSETPAAALKEVMKAKVSGIRTSPEDNKEVVPVNGMVSFNHYIETNRKLPLDSGNVHGSVVVSFIVNEDGTLSDFKIEKSLTRKTDNEAIRLVKEGPAWKALKDRKAVATVIINF